MSGSRGQFEPPPEGWLEKDRCALRYGPRRADTPDLPAIRQAAVQEHASIQPGPGGLPDGGDHRSSSSASSTMLALISASTVRTALGRKPFFPRPRTVLSATSARRPSSAEPKVSKALFKVSMALWNADAGEV